MPHFSIQAWLCVDIVEKPLSLALHISVQI